MTRVVMTPGLDARLARDVAAPAVARVRDRALPEAQRLAPAVKVWHCFSPWTRVAATGVTLVARRRETRSLLRLTFRSSRRASAAAPADRILTVTPDHQLMTPNGWIEAKSLQEGDYALGCSTLRGQTAVAPHIEDGPPTIAEVFRAASLLRRPRRVVRTLLDLDGDPSASGIESEIEVVVIDGELRQILHAEAVKMLPQHILGLTDLDLPAAFLGTSLRAESSVSPRPAPGLLAALAGVSQGGGSVSLPAEPSRIGEGPPLHALLTEDASDCWLTGADGPSQRSDGRPAHVETCEVRSVEVVPSGCHVYDLTTGSGWLLAQGILAHNSARDERVRPAHADADRQAVPDNLRYVLEKADGGPGVDLARRPRDPDLPFEQVVNCRCSSERDPDLLRDSILATPLRVEGTRVHTTFGTVFPRAVESEIGTDEDEAARFMRGACQRIAAGS